MDKVIDDQGFEDIKLEVAHRAGGGDRDIVTDKTNNLEIPSQRELWFSI